MGAAFGWLFTRPRYVPRESAPECYTTLLCSTGSPECPTLAHNFLMSYSPVIVAVLVGICLLAAHFQVFHDRRNRPAREILQEDRSRDLPRFVVRVAFRSVSFERSN